MGVPPGKKNYPTLKGTQLFSSDPKDFGVAPPKQDGELLKDSDFEEQIVLGVCIRHRHGGKAMYAAQHNLIALPCIDDATVHQ